MVSLHIIPLRFSPSRPITALFPYPFVGTPFQALFEANITHDHYLTLIGSLTIIFSFAHPLATRPQAVAWAVPSQHDMMSFEGDLRLACSQVVSSEGGKAEPSEAVTYIDGRPGVGVALRQGCSPE